VKPKPFHRVLRPCDVPPETRRIGLASYQLAAYDLRLKALPPLRWIGNRRESGVPPGRYLVDHVASPKSGTPGGDALAWYLSPAAGWGRLRGRSFGVYVRASLPPGVAALVVCHELQHHRQFERDGHKIDVSSYADRPEEIEARAYEQDIIRRTRGIAGRHKAIVVPEFDPAARSDTAAQEMFAKLDRLIEHFSWMSP
jgi:hypothetical protein